MGTKIKVVIMAGGRGTRISSIASDIPKPMIKVGDKPVLEHLINNLKKQDYIDIIIVTGYLGNIISDYFEDGSRFGVNIQYYKENEPLGTAGALFHLKENLTNDFFLLNGDIIIDIDFDRFFNYHKGKNAWASLLTHPNNHPYDSALIESDSQGRITNWSNKEDARKIYKNRVNAGVHILSKVLLDHFVGKTGKIDLDRGVLKPAISTGRVFAYDSPEYVKDMGTPERYYKVCEDYASGKVFEKNLMNKQKAIFLDRDGTINKYVGFLNSHQQMELLDGVAEAISKINDSGFLAIVITNQPVIARGECTLDELRMINNKMETLLGEKGAYIDDLFFCPHHPDKGFAGERIEYKIKCQCRKPKPGLIYEAEKKYNIDLSQSYMVGDSCIDVETGLAAGCQPVFVGKQDDKKNENNVYKYPNLLSFVNDIIMKN